MSIASRIEAIEQHLTDDYNVLEVAGVDLTNVDKNILNLKTTWQERLLYFINNGTDVVWNNWDKVTGEGTILTLNNTEEAPMKINLKGNTSQATSILPSEYTQVDYIESSGTQYIDTGVAPSTSTGIDITYIDNNQETGTDTLIGSGTSTTTGYYGITRRNNQLQLYWGNAITITNYTFTFDVKHNIKFNINSSRKLYIDDVAKWTVSEPSSTLTSNTMTLFAFKYTSIVQYADATKLYSCKIYDGANLVRNFVPCYRNSDNEVGLYDLVNNVFYTNAGTGAFTYGAVATLPNPDYPQDIHVVSGDNTIKVEGKNLFDKNNINGLNAYLDTTNNKLVSNNNNKSIYISCKPNTIYTISKTPSKRFGVAYTYTTPANNTAIYGTITNYDGASITITTDTNAQYIVVWLINSNISGEISYQTAIDTLLIEYGNQVTTYVSYQTPQTYPINLGDIELCKIGDYQDTIVKDNGKWYLNKQIGKVVLDGSENWSKSSSSTNDIFVGNNVLSNNASLTNRASSLSNYFTYNQSITITNKFYITDNKKTIAIVFTAYGNTTLEQFISWLSTHNTIVYYILETPTYTEMTDSTLLSQLNALAKSYTGQTNISQESNDLASILNATALKEMA